MRVRNLFSSILIMMFLMLLPSKVNAQNQKVKLTGKDITLKMAFEQIERQTGLSVDYDAKTIDVTKVLKSIPKPDKLQEVMTQLLQGTNSKFTINKSHVIITFPDVQQKTTSDNESLQTKFISGVVTDVNGEPLIGASVIVNRTNKGTVTDLNGKYKIETSKGEVLAISYTGYDNKQVTVDDNSNVNVQLSEKSNLLNEVVAIGYGQQKRVNIIGAVSTIAAKSIESRSATTMSGTLAGLAAGVYVKQGGQPGAEGTTITIRGTGTLNGTSPLVIIDGIVGSLDFVNPDDVESISILKDAATAAIYGSLASNGVILITTKKGTKNKTTVTYTGITARTRPMNTPGFVSDYARHMQLVNEGFSNLGQTPPYAAATIAEWQAATADPNGLNSKGVPNYVAYANTDWTKWLFSQNQLLQSHNLSLDGGNDNTQYLMSAKYLKNPGTMPNTGMDQYQFRVNLQSKVTSFLTVGTQSFGSVQNNSVTNPATAFTYLTQTVPGIYPIYNGHYGVATALEENPFANNPYNRLFSTGGATQVSEINSTVFANLIILKGLTLEAKAHYDNYYVESNTQPLTAETWNLATNTLATAKNSPSQANTSYSLTKRYNVVFDDVLRYTTVIGKDHEISVLAGYNQQYFNQYNFSASKLGLLDASITTLNSASNLQSISGTESDYAIRSYFGRFNYNYKHRYLFEAVARDDGSSRFSAQNRWGLFPSFSGGWQISEEPFMKNFRNVLSSLKLRASWGKTGNNASGDYDYQSTYTPDSYSFNGTAVTGLNQSKISNPSLHWETTTTTDVGLDGTIFNGAMNFTIDYYRGETNGILFVPTIPITVGTASAATQNLAAVSKNGIELSLGYNGKVGDFRYNVTGNIAYNTNKVTNYKGTLQEGYITDANGNRTYTSNLGSVSSGSTTRILEGHRINEYYLYPIYKGNATYFNSDGSVNKNGGPKDGMIRTTQDMAWLQAMSTAGYKFQPAGSIAKNKIYYGDLIYADTNNDGIYGNTYDEQFTGKNSSPSINYGFAVNLAYKGFDMQMQWAGAAGMSYFWNDAYLNQSIVQLGYSVPTLVANDHYYYNDANPADPANNINGHYPRLKNSTDAQNSLQSDYYLYDASYLKLKNLQIGYTLPVSLIKKVSLSNVRVYIGGENLLLITKYPGLDPEIGAGLSYPTMRQYSLGLNVTF